MDGTTHSRSTTAARGLLASLFLVCASSADAISPEAPASRPALPGLATHAAEPADPLYFVARSNELGPVGGGQALRPQADTRVVAVSGFRNRRIKVIHYATPLRVAQNEMMLNLEAPGAGNAIVSVELKF